MFPPHPPPQPPLGILSWACGSLVHAVITSVSSFVQLSYSAGKRVSLQVAHDLQYLCSFFFLFWSGPWALGGVHVIKMVHLGQNTLKSLILWASVLIAISCKKKLCKYPTHKIYTTNKVMSGIERNSMSSSGFCINVHVQLHKHTHIHIWTFDIHTTILNMHTNTNT